MFALPNSLLKVLHFLWFPMFLRIFPSGWNGRSRESPGGSPPFSRNRPVDSPNQILIPPLNNDFQVITQYKLHLWLQSLMCHFFLTHLVLQGQAVSFEWSPSYDITQAKIVTQLHNLAILQLHCVTSFAKITAQDCKRLKRQIFLGQLHHSVWLF